MFLNYFVICVICEHAKLIVFSVISLKGKHTYMCRNDNMEQITFRRLRHKNTKQNLLKVAVSGDFWPFFKNWTQAKMVFLKDSFLQRYLRNKWLHADLQCTELNCSNFKVRISNLWEKFIFGCQSGAQVGSIQGNKLLQNLVALPH